MGFYKVFKTFINLNSLSAAHVHGSVRKEKQFRNTLVKGGIANDIESN